MNRNQPCIRLQKRGVMLTLARTIETTHGRDGTPCHPRTLLRETALQMETSQRTARECHPYRCSAKQEHGNESAVVCNSLQ
jgi:hypothetical protein